jgi:hypothetical protein
MEVYIFHLKMENHIHNLCPDYTYTLSVAVIVITVLICVLVEPIVGLF